MPMRTAPYSTLSGARSRQLAHNSPMRRLVWLFACALGSGCMSSSSSTTAAGSSTPADVKTFLDDANETSLDLGIAEAQAGWVQQNFITDDTEGTSARASQAANEASKRLAKEATRFDKVTCRPTSGGC